MKKLFFIFLLFSYPLILLGQGNVFGVKAGSNLTYFHNVNSEAKIGYTFGLFYDIALYKELLFSLEINYTVNNCLLSKQLIYLVNPDESYFYDFHLSVHYVALPMFIRYNIRLDHEMVIQPFLGYTLITLNVGDETTWENRKFLNYGKPLEKSDLQSFGEQNLSNNRYGINFGSKLYYKNIFLELRYFISLNNIGGFNTVETTKDNFKSETFKILIGYSF